METLSNGSNGSKETANLKLEVLMVPCRSVRPLPDQPRKYFKKSSLQELADSIQEVGQVTPAQVRRLIPPVDGQEFELIDGERRFRACVMLNRHLKVEVDPEMKDPKSQYKKAVAANFGREGHTPIESAKAIYKLREECGETIEAVARIMGKSSGWVVQHSNLLKLDPQVITLLEPEKTPEEKLLSINIALVLISVPMPYQLDLAKRISELRLGMDKARHLINTTMRDRGISHARLAPAREFGRISGLAKRSNDHFKMFAEISETQLAYALKGRSLQHRMQFLENLASLSQHVKKFEKRVEKILTKG